MAEQRPQIPYFKEFLPTPVCIVLSLFFAMVFQFNGGVFLPAATQMSSALGCIQEDVTMAGYASFIGMTVIFPVLFRLKSRFTTRSIFMTVCPVLILCNLDHHAYRKHLSHDLCMLRIGILPHVGHLRVFLQYPPEHYTFRKFLGILSRDLYHRA